MNKKILSIIFVGMFLLTGLTASSVVGIESTNNEVTNQVLKSKTSSIEQYPDLTVKTIYTIEYKTLRWIHIYFYVKNIGEEAAVFPANCNFIKVTHFIRSTGETIEYYLKTKSGGLVLNPGEDYITYQYQGPIFGFVGDVITTKVDPDFYIDEGPEGEKNNEHVLKIKFTHQAASYSPSFAFTKFATTPTIGADIIESNSASENNLAIQYEDSIQNSNFINDFKPDWLWVDDYESSKYAQHYGTDIGFDNSGNVYLVGNVEGGLDFGEHELVGSGLFVAKLDEDGKCLWASKTTGSGPSSEAIYISDEGEVYLTGSFSGTTNFGSYTLTSDDGDAFVAKMDNDGKWVWAVSAGGSGSGICLDSNGNLYLAGTFLDTVTLGPFNLTSEGYKTDAYIAKLNSNGEFLWVEQINGSGYVHSRKIGIDYSENLYITGYISFGETKFGDITLNCDGFGQSAAFVAKMDNDGNWIWAEQSGCGKVYLNDACISVYGNTYVTGRFDWSVEFGSDTLNTVGGSDIFVAKIDKNGNWIWAVSAGGTYGDDGCGIGIDNYENVYFGGEFRGPATFGPITLEGIKEIDMFIARLDINGNWIWAEQGGGDWWDACADVEADNNGNVYLTGDYTLSAVIGGFNLHHSSAYYTSSIYTAKLCTPPTKPKISGPKLGRPGIPYTYNFSSMDSDGDQIRYIIYWGDSEIPEETGYLNSGEVASISHTWTGQDYYRIRASAVNERGVESKTAYIEVLMSKSKSFNINLMFQIFLENHPNMFPISRELLGL